VGAIVAVLFGTLYGALAGFVGGPVDSFMMRIVDAGLSIPYIMVLIILSVIFHPNTLTMIFIIAVFYWLGVARLIRGETLTLRTREYVQAVKVIGGGQKRPGGRRHLPDTVCPHLRPGPLSGPRPLILLPRRVVFGLVGPRP